jgi:vacuolar-type H+-ATPase subunit I/STV1
MSYSLTLHKKSYLLKGITKDDSNKEKVKELGAKWNSGLGGWLFFPDKHKDGLKFAKKIGAEINVESEKKESPKKENKRESKEGVEDENEELIELREKYSKLKLKHKKLKTENKKLQDTVERLQDRVGRMGDKLGAMGESDCDEENKEENKE